jgi:hypothetical protein
MKVGDKVYLVPMERSNAARRYKEPIEAVVTKIGNKYYYANVGYGNDRKINKENNIVDNGIYSSEFIAYFDLTEVIKEKEIDEMLKEIRVNIGDYGKSNLTNKQIEQIYEIITKTK